MKRLLSMAIALMLCIVACFSLVACSDKDTGEDLVNATVKVKIYNGTADAKEVENAGLYKTTINQAPEHLIGKEKPFIELIPAAMAAAEA